MNHSESYCALSATFEPVASRHAATRLRPRVVRLVVVLASALTASVGLSVGACRAVAQMPTIPVLQNGFASRGMTLALNYGSGTGSDAYAVAAGWGPASQRFQISGALGGVRPDTGGPWTGYGVRAAIPLWSGMADRLGVAMFAGAGGARRDTTSIARVPVGLGVGYRFAIGETRSVSTYASPFFVWSRLSERGTRAQADNAMRGSVAVDLVLTRNVGLTAGYEFGGGTGDASPGGSNRIFGAAVSYAFR